MKKFKLYNGSFVDQKYFDDTLNDLINEDWELKSIAQLVPDHVNCLLSFETISKDTSGSYYESDKNNIVSVRAYEEYIRPNKNKFMNLP